MVAITRSQVKKAEESKKLAVSKSGAIKEADTKVAEKKTWRDWMTNWVVMDKAMTLWIHEIFCKKQRKENPALLGTHKYKYLAKREWDSMPDTDKAPFITNALKSLAGEAGVLQRARMTRKAVKETSKQRRERIERELDDACCIFIGETYYANHFMTHSDIRLTKDISEAASREWAAMAESDRAVYVAKVKQRKADRLEVYEHPWHDEAYKDLL